MSIEAEVMKQFQQAQGDSGKPATQRERMGEYRSAHGGPVEILTSADVAARLAQKAVAFQNAQAAGMYQPSSGAAQVKHNGGTGERHFTRSEVVAALRTLKTTVDNFNAHEALDCAIRAFQRME